MLSSWMTLGCGAVIIGALVVTKGHKEWSYSATVSSVMVVDLVLGRDLFGLPSNQDILARVLFALVIVLVMAATGSLSATKPCKDRSNVNCLTPVQYPRLWTGAQTNVESPE